MASMADRERAEEVARSVPDPDAFREACDVFGEADALARLQLFCTDLETQLARFEQGLPDREQLREIAHRTAGRAGLFGFPALVEASVCLDDAIRGDTGMMAALARWIEQARRATTLGTDDTAAGSRGPFR